MDAMTEQGRMERERAAAGKVGKGTLGKFRPVWLGFRDADDIGGDT